MKLTRCTWLLCCCVAQQAVLAAPHGYGGRNSAPTVKIAPGVIVGTMTLVPSATAGGQQVPRNPICQVAARTLFSARGPKALVKAIICQGRQTSMCPAMEL